MQFTCPTCSEPMRCPDEYAGRKVNCPKCRQRIQVPAVNKTMLGKLEEKTPPNAIPARVPPLRLLLGVGMGVVLFGCMVCLAGGIWIGYSVGSRQAKVAPEAPQVDWAKEIQRVLEAESAKIDRLEAEEANKEKVTRANFNTMRWPLRLSEAQVLLGPARVDTSVGTFVSVSWRSKDGRCTIFATFEAAEGSPWLVGKSIIGD